MRSKSRLLLPRRRDQRCLDCGELIFPGARHQEHANVKIKRCKACAMEAVRLARLRFLGRPAFKRASPPPRHYCTSLAYMRRESEIDEFHVRHRARLACGVIL